MKNVKEREEEELTVIHEGILELGTGEADVGEVVEHAPRGAGVDDSPEAEQSHPSDERQHVRARRLHRQHYNRASPVDYKHSLSTSQCLSR